MHGRRRRRDERGETLVELLVAIVIIGTAVVAVMAGLQLSIKASDLNRRQANSGSAVRSAAEVIERYVNADKANYDDCASANAYRSQVTLDLPSGYTATQSAAQAWNGTSWVTCTASLDKGVQRVLLTVSSPGSGARQANETLYLVLRKPCNGAIGNAC